MFKSWLKKILIISLELLLISGALWYAAEKKGIKTPGGIIPAIEQTALQSVQDAQKKPFPQLENPTTQTFNWTYKGVSYSLNETLYRSTYKYYQSEPKTFSYAGQPPANWEDDYYGMFLNGNNQDPAIAQLAQNLQDVGRRHNLSEDQIVDLTLSFVQSIPYDDAKAKDILSKTGSVTMRYPYEVLFEHLGVCSDKSLLATAVLRQMGYGVALFAFEQDNHMAIGIQCPQNISTYGSGYCYAETTAVGNKIGIVPSFDAQSNKTVGDGQLSTFNPNQTQQTNLQQLGQVTIYQKTSGKEYLGVALTQKNMAEIAQLKKNIDSSLSALNVLKKNVSSESDDLRSMKNDLDAYQKSQNVEKYNALVEKYNSLLQIYQNDVKKYNNSVTLYNQTIQRYNLLIKQ